VCTKYTTDGGAALAGVGCVMPRSSEPHAAAVQARTALRRQQRRTIELSRRGIARSMKASTASFPSTLPCALRGATMRSGETQCRACWDKSRTERMLPVAAKGRMLAQTPTAQARRAATRRQQLATEHAWRPSDQPAWLTERVYIERIVPRLKTVSATKIAAALGCVCVVVRVRRPRKQVPISSATLANLGDAFRTPPDA
jgi:hypothetical protein